MVDPKNKYKKLNADMEIGKDLVDRSSNVYDVHENCSTCSEESWHLLAFSRSNNYTGLNVGNNNDKKNIEEEGSLILYDDLLNMVQFGNYQRFLTILAGIIDAGDAVEVMSMSFVLDPASEEFHASSSEKAWLSAVVFAGMLIGGYLWGALADTYGRKACLLWSLMLNIVFGFGGALVPSMAWLIAFRFMSGVGVGGSMPVIFSYICEILPQHNRGKYLVIVACFWMLGSVACAGLAWAIIPLTFEVHFLGQVWSSWRLFLGVCALPNLLGITGLYFAPESPRFLLAKGDSRGAFSILARMHKYNSGQVLKTYIPVITFEDSDYEDSDTDLLFNQTLADVETLKRTTTQGRLYKFVNVFHTTVELFQGPVLMRTILLTCAWFGLSFGTYGMAMWLPSYFERRFSDSGIGSDSGLSTYANSFLVSLSQFPINLLSVYSVDRIGRKITLAISMTIAGISILFVPFFTSLAGVVVMNCIFGGFSMGGWNALNILSTELFPTRIRSTGFGFLSAIGRIAAILANFLFGYLATTGNGAIPMFMVAGFMILGSLSVMFLPDYRKIIML